MVQIVLLLKSKLYTDIAKTLAYVCPTCAVYTLPLSTLSLSHSLNQTDVHLHKLAMYLHLLSTTLYNTVTGGFGCAGVPTIFCGGFDHSV